MASWNFCFLRCGVPKGGGGSSLSLAAKLKQQIKGTLDISSNCTNMWLQWNQANHDMGINTFYNDMVISVPEICSPRINSPLVPALKSRTLRLG